MMVMSISIIAIIALGGVLGIFRETLVVTFAAFIMKFIIGGPHLSGFFRCLLYSTVLIFTGTWLCNIYQSWLTVPIVLSVLLLNILIIFKVQLAPSYRSFNHIQTLRRKVLASILVLLSVTLYFMSFKIWGSGALIGFSISILNISPMGISFVGWLDRITKQGGAVQ